MGGSSREHQKFSVRTALFGSLSDTVSQCGRANSFGLGVVTFQSQLMQFAVSSPEELRSALDNCLLSKLKKVTRGFKWNVNQLFWNCRVLAVSFRCCMQL